MSGGKKFDRNSKTIGGKLRNKDSQIEKTLGFVLALVPTNIKTRTE